MVQISNILFHDKVLRPFRRKFIDSLRLHVKGGAGGMGFPKYGGIGGKGGDVYVEANEEVTLRMIKQKYPTSRFAAGNGGNSGRHRILGELGKDLSIESPVGITVYSEQQKLLGSLDKTGDRLLVARGGVGGYPGNQFCGQRGQAHSIVFDLKLIADVGLVGFPNAGKSSFLNSISRASTRVASFPFTTLNPQLGVITYDDLRQISIADLPGLIEGAHVNVGLGHSFLKHIERTKILLFVIDINGFQLNPQTKPRSALETVVLLNKELELYDEDLINKSAVLLINKMDTAHADNKLLRILDDLKNIKDATSTWPDRNVPSKFISFDDVIPISTKTGQRVDIVQKRLRELIDYYEDQKQTTLQDVRNLGVMTRKTVAVKFV